VREVLRGRHDLLMKEAEPNLSMLFGSTDMHLLRCCPCPLWLFKPEHAGRNFGQVLAAVDPAPPPDDADLLHLKTELAPKDETLNAKILELAVSLADEKGAELHVVHAWSAPGEGLVRGDLMLAQEQVERYVEDSRAEARKALDHLLEKFPDQSGRRFVHLLKGDPAEVIAEFVITGRVDLIVMGTVARTGIPGLLMGNTAETILQRVDCSVLAVKPDGFVSPLGLDE
jgi:universal stress protein E